MAFIRATADNTCLLDAHPTPESRFFMVDAGCWLIKTRLESILPKAIA